MCFARPGDAYWWTKASLSFIAKPARKFYACRRCLFNWTSPARAGWTRNLREKIFASKLSVFESETMPKAICLLAGANEAGEGGCRHHARQYGYLVGGTSSAKATRTAATRSPYVMAGSAGGYIKTRRFLKYNNDSHSNLLVSVANAMGCPSTRLAIQRIAPARSGCCAGKVWSGKRGRASLLHPLLGFLEEVGPT